MHPKVRTLSSRSIESIGPIVYVRHFQNVFTLITANISCQTERSTNLKVLELVYQLKSWINSIHLFKSVYYLMS